MNQPYTKSLDHLGLVAGFCKEINLANTIDRALGHSSQRKVSFGHLFVAMLLNGLGFTGRTLHMYFEYFEDKDLQRLLGIDITPESLNDDALGRCFDALYEHGVSRLYQDISETVVKTLGLPCDSVHLDGTSFHYDGQEKIHDGTEHHIQIMKGYSRDHRPDLNQAILQLICENTAGIPVYMAAASGNCNDMDSFKKIVKSHVQCLKAAHKSRYLVADAALYVQETITHLTEINQLFITRVPQTLKEAKDLIVSAKEQVFEGFTEGYEGVWVDSDYGDVKQRWLLIRSEQAKKREQHSLNKRMLKNADTERKRFKSLTQLRFSCTDDAQKALVQWRQKQKYLDVVSQIIEVPVFAGKGRPKKGQAPERIDYQITGDLFTRVSEREKAIDSLGLFIIATNDLSKNLTMEKLLSTYKSQQSVEKGFRFLKSPDFLVNAIFLHKPERIEALLMVMTTCLMVYAALEHKIRKELKHQDKYFPDQKKKPSQKPTARWVFQCFANINMLYVNEQDPMTINLKDRQKVIIDCLGEIYQQIYY